MQGKNTIDDGSDASSDESPGSSRSSGSEYDVMTSKGFFETFREAHPRLRDGE